MTNPTKIVHNCETGVTEEVELTAEEIAEMETQRLAFVAEQAERDAEVERVAALKVSAKAKLVSGTKLTAEEAALIIG